MADVVVLGGGISGHTAALHLRRMLGSRGGHTVTVVTPNANWNWIPSNIWVGVGKMTKPDVGLPARARLSQEGHRLPPGQGRGDPPAGRRGRRPRRRRHRLHRPGQGGRRGADPLRLPHQRHRPPAALRGDRGPRPRRAHRVGLHRGPRHRGGGRGSPRRSRSSRRASPRPSSSAWATAPAPARARPSSTSSTSTTSCARPGSAIAPASSTSPTRRELGDFGVDGMTFAEQGFETTSELWTDSLFRRARRRGDPRRPRHQGRAGSSSTTRRSTASSTSCPSTSRCCCRRSAASPWRRTTRRGTTSPPSCSRPAAS